MTRAAAIAAAEAYFDDGGFAADLARRVAIPTESQVEERGAGAAAPISPTRSRRPWRGSASPARSSTIPVRGGPILIAERREDGRGDDRARLRPRRRHPRARAAMARRAVAVGADPAGRPALRPRHRRQQGPALDQPRRARLRAGDARPARLQRRVPDRDRRGDRLAGPARDLPRAQGPARRRCADRLGRAAPRAGAADDLSRRARRDEFRPGRRSARGRPPFGQLGRPARQSRHHPGACAGVDHQREGRDPDQGVGADATCRTRCAWRWPTAPWRAARTRPRSTPIGASRA